MKKTIFLCLAALLFIVTGCKKELDVYTGPTIVEFNPAIKSVAVGTVAIPGFDDVKIQLVGPQRSTDTELTYTIDATNSTAVAGTHYNIANVGKVILPANSSFGYIRINLVPGSITTESKKLVLTLVGNADVKASANYKTYTLTITK
jgi:hypothetical protein